MQRSVPMQDYLLVVKVVATVALAGLAVSWLRADERRPASPAEAATDVSHLGLFGWANQESDVQGGLKRVDRARGSAADHLRSETGVFS